ncbi:MFS transporter [Actinomadura sp. NPDC048394]|uniref:MFS transporter n=1 Tax=Actinomadura sp. NPDC048394 TaxID=3158223 RepID=UPI0033C67E54
MPHQPRLRLARAVVFATVCLALTTAGHAYAAHAAVPPSAVGLGFLLVTGFSLLLTGTERSFWTILGGLLGAEFGLHALFARASAGTSVHHHGGAPVPAAHGHGGWAMTAVHLATALVAAVWLRRGEAAMWSLARKVSAAAAGPWRLLLAAALSPAAPPAAPVMPAAGPVRPAAVAPLRHALVRRGPPA